MDMPPLTLIIGAAASGKSRFAEHLILAAPRKAYIATAQAYDDEMRAKIQAHADRRGPEWRTLNAPLDLPSALAQIRTDEVCLLDCASMWLSNHLLAESDLTRNSRGLITALARCAAPVIVVTNEVGAGIVPDNALARRFREAQGRLNQDLAQAAARVALVSAGLPIWLKGSA